MKPLVKLICLAAGLLSVGSAAGRDGPAHHSFTDGTHTVLTNANVGGAVAARDTIYLMGGDGDWSGKFETPGGAPDWHGWTHYDDTAPLSGYWHVDTYHMENLNNNGAGNHGAWCGSILLPACPGETEPGGYGNDWQDGLDYWGTVADPGLVTSVDIDFYFNLDTEDSWDWFDLNVDRGGTWSEQLHVSGVLQNEHYAETITFAPEDYVNGNQFHLQLKVTSDGGGSDQDCLRPSSGAVQIDDITVSGDNGVVTYFEDFEGDSLGDWVPTSSLGAGDFSKLWTNLIDIDECGTNFTTQVAFVDDGLVVPGTGGQMCITWCYGPGGYIVNTTGGLTGGHLHNTIQSPPLVWPDGDYAGATLRFDVYRHFPVGTDHAGIHYGYAVGSTDSGDPAYLPVGAWSGWVLEPGDSPEYVRHEIPVAADLVPGRTHVQIRLFITELGWAWGLGGDDGTPAPYFDNVALLAYSFDGPAISAREIDLAQDTFPASGSIDYDDLSNNWCRFDAALNIAPPAHLANDPGDSIVFDVAPLRAGAELTAPPRLYYKIKPNPLFDDFRLQPPGPTGFIEGFADADTARNSAGQPVDRKWAVDLPDTGFFFPGDVMHYFFSATDDPGGDPRTATLPADTSGFSNFNKPLVYPSSTIVRFLPTIFSSYPGDHPNILWWNDFGGRGGENKWYYALGPIGYCLEGVDYDTYYTNGPTSGVGNGLGGRASAAQLDGYDIILYTSGDLSANTISNGDPNYDAGRDIQLLDAWLQTGSRDMFLTGDDLAFDLDRSGPETAALLTDWIGVEYQARSVREFIGNQSTPYVNAIPGNPVFWLADEWIAFGQCPGINQFDAVVEGAAAQRIAEFLAPDGQGGAYPFAAALYHDVSDFDNQFVYLPYDFAYIYTAPGNSGFPARARLLNDVLSRFGSVGSGYAPVPVADAFAVRNFPNPFNPQTKIEFTLPVRGRVTVKIYDVRGALLRTVIDDVRDAGIVHEVVWNGTDDRGAEVSSGLYFYELKSGDLTKVGKMTLVK